MTVPRFARTMNSQVTEYLLPRVFQVNDVSWCDLILEDFLLNKQFLLPSRDENLY